MVNNQEIGNILNPLEKSHQEESKSESVSVSRSGSYMMGEEDNT